MLRERLAFARSVLTARGKGTARTAYRPRLEGLEERVVLTTLPPGFTQTLVGSGLGSPTAMEFSPDGRLFVLDQVGNVKLLRADGTIWTALHLNVDSSGERGLLGIAFDPNYKTNHFVYLYYTNPNPGAAPWAQGEHNQLSRFTVNDTIMRQPVFTNEKPILDLNKLSGAQNHNGGAIHFGIGGLLYVGTGDNVQTFTQGGNTYRVAQSLSSMLGKLLRIDVGAFNNGTATRNDATVGHLIPSSNPFVGQAPGINQLIFALGLRNPYTFAVQPGTGKIFINDVGEVTWEEINQAVAGANYGWSGGETDGFGQHPPGPGPYHNPLLAYNHSGGPAGGGSGIVGGAFYNPPTTAYPSNLVGKYFYSDLSAGWIRIFNPANPGTAANPDRSSGFASGDGGGVVDLKVGSAGNLNYLSFDNNGSVFRIFYHGQTPNAQPSQTPRAEQTVQHTTAISGASLQYQWQRPVGAAWASTTATTNTTTHRTVISRRPTTTIESPLKTHWTF